MLCDSNIERYIRKNNYESFNRLTPTKRFTEKFTSSKLPQYKFFGGQPIDVNFGIDMVRNHKKEIRALIDIYLERGGLQFQVNSVSSKLLREAMENPEKYPNLVVRIGGYSIYFKNISKESQKEFVERFEKEGL